MKPPPPVSLRLEIMNLAERDTNITAVSITIARAIVDFGILI